MLVLRDWWDEALGGLMPLRPEDTGLDIRVWCWCSPASDDVQVAVTASAPLADGEGSMVAPRPALRVVDGEPVSGRDLDLLARWLSADDAAASGTGDRTSWSPKTSSGPSSPPGGVPAPGRRQARHDVSPARLSCTRSEGA